MRVDEKKRVLWLMNHTTLRQFELPILASMGYEIFLPKSFPYDEGNLSASVDRAYDKTLSIPAEALDHLNRQDFYTYLSEATADIVNSYFDVAIIGFFPKQLDGLVRDFAGTIVMCPFGLANGVTYTDVIADCLGQKFFARLERIQHRFWFGQAYDNLAAIETGILREKAIHLPLGLPPSERAAWEGTDAKVFFVCPRIRTSPYFRNIYDDFKKNFGDLPHLIGGAQPIAVDDDPNVLGFLPRRQYDELFRDVRVMFYHSRERHHLHYHPHEAIATGMPLVFMSGGMLDHLGGEHLPGRARTVKEARTKLNRILRGDRRFTDAVRGSQKVLLESFSWDHCRQVWADNFRKITAAAAPPRVVTIPRVESRGRLKVAMILTEPYRGGTLEVVKIAAKMLHRGSAQAGNPCDVFFYHPPSSVYSERDFADLAAEGIPSQELTWKIVDSDAATNTLALNGWRGPLPRGNTFAIPEDNADNLASFDHWIFLTDRFPERVLPLRPYSVYVHDLLQRYVPSLFGNHYERSIVDSIRGAEQVLCSTDHTYSDVIQYIGAYRDKVRLVPLVAELAPILDPLRESEEAGIESFFLWPTNASFHKNHFRTIAALEHYYKVLNGRLKCVITGVNTNWFDPDASEPTTDWDYPRRVRKAFQTSKLVDRHIEFAGDLPRPRYWQLLRQAKFVIHPALIDNGTLVAVEAASVGAPLLSHDYPPMRYYERRFSIPIKFVDARDAEDLGEGILTMEREARDLRTRMPSREALQEFHWHNQAALFWATIRPGIM